MRLFSCCLIGGYLVISCFAWAAAEPEPRAPRVLTLADALTRAEAASPLVQRARAEREVVAARDVGASALLPSNPVVAGAAGPYREPGVSAVEILLHAEQTIEIGGQRGARRAVVSRAVQAAAWREQVARMETRARVRAAYVAAQLARAQQEAAAAREALMTTLLDAVRVRVTSGASSNVDLELARLERGVAARAKAAASLAAADPLARLRALIGLAPGEPITVDPRVSAPPPRAGGLRDLLARAERQRAELEALRSSGAELDAEIARLRREAIPSPTLFVDFERDRPGQVFLGGGLSIPIPIWRRQQGELAVARAERNRVEDERALAAREVALEVERAFQSVDAQDAAARIMDRDVLPAAEAAARLLTDGWRAGKFDLFRVLQTLRDASEARRLYLETLGALWEATIALDRAVGGE
ncbi:MAG TPA: TolC family protein [Polyangia bacterium]|nr:TolC family protein [Polyangia bacterium]